MLALPVYKRGSTFYLHTRIDGQQVKRSLGTPYRRIAIMRAVTLLNSLMSSQKPVAPSKYELDVSRGILKADGPEDHQRLMDALAVFKAMNGIAPAPAVVAPAPVLDNTPPPNDPTALRLGELLEKYFALNKCKQSTVIAYRNCVESIAKFLKNPPITRITKSDITRFQEFCAANGNSPRTIDNKVGIISTLLNFAITQGYTRENNPASGRALVSKQKRLKGGYEFFKQDEVTAIFQSEFFETQKIKSPDYACAVVLGIMTGCRISEILGLKKSNFKKTDSGIPYIRIEDSKTSAGVREVPLHRFAIEFIKPLFDKRTDELFKYKEKEGKGRGNAVGKMFARNIAAAQITRDKLVFHSLRKFVNHELSQNKVGLEIRCQFIGHEPENVNIATYTDTFSVEELAIAVFPVFDKIAAKLNKGKFDFEKIDFTDLIEPM